MQQNRLFILTIFLFIVASVKAQHTSHHFLADSTDSPWKKENLRAGLTHYVFEGFYEPTNSAQVINVLDMDVNRQECEIMFVDSRPSDSLSSIVKRIPGAIAGINGTYYEIVKNKKNPQKQLSSSFFKSKDKINVEVTVPEKHRLFWKHEGAFYYDPAKQKNGIVYGDNNSYKQMPYANIVSGSPMLIFNYKPVGENFVKPGSKHLDSLDYEDPDRHQGVRHPRTAVARTEDNHLLFITVDGRAEEAAGMSAKELTQFISRWFNPKYALNLDGGGSTTMWIKDSNKSTTGVVNYPTDDKTFDHYGQRKIRNALIITKK